MSTIRPLLDPAAFSGPGGVVHLCTGGEAPWMRAHDAVYADFARLKGQGEAGRREIYRLGEECRTRVGALWGCGRPRGRSAPPRWR